jgi:hypothetical protein
MIQLLLCTAALVLSFVPRVAAPGPEFDLDEFKKTYVRSSEWLASSRCLPAVPSAACRGLLP